MIGQKELFEKVRSSNARSILLTGPAHFGKKTFIRELLAKEESVFEVTGNATAFREAVERICTTVRPTSYIIPDLDKRHPTVQNLLLKVIEEPPLQSKFYITASGGLLPTIVSRCVSYRIMPYTKDQLMQVKCAPWSLDYGNSPGQLQLISAVDLSEVIPKLYQLKDDIKAGNHTLAYYLKTFRDINKQWYTLNASHESFVLLVSKIFGEQSSAVGWLRQQPEDSVRYVRTHFIMKYWVEQQEMI